MAIFLDDNVKILHAPSQLFFHNLSLMNLGFFILEYGHLTWLSKK